MSMGLILPITGITRTELTPVGQSEQTKSARIRQGNPPQARAEPISSKHEASMMYDQEGLCTYPA